MICLGDLLRFLPVLVFLQLLLNTLKFKVKRAVSAPGAVLFRRLRTQEASGGVVCSEIMLKSSRAFSFSHENKTHNKLILNFIVCR